MATPTNPSIGSQTFIRKQGPSALALATVVQEITRNNSDGHAWLEIGRRASPVTWITEVNSNAPDTLESSYMALKGTLQTVVTEDGKSFLNVMVLDCEVLEKRKTLNGLGGISANGHGWHVTARWVLQGSL